MSAAGPRVLVVTPVFPPARGGIETLTEAIVRGLEPWSVEVVTSVQDGSVDWDAASGLKVFRASNRPRGGRRAMVALNLLAIRRAWRGKPDVVLNMYVRTALGAHLMQRLRRVRWVQYYHAKEIPAFGRAARRAARYADAHVAVSRYTADLLTDVGAPPERIAVIPPAAARSVQVSGHPQGRSASVMLTVSRLDDAYKGHDVILAALPAIRAAVPNVRWVVVGTGALREQLEQEVTETGLADIVEFCGHVDDQQREELLRTSSVFVLPSRVPADGQGGEGFGIVYVEAAAAGLPVVAGHQGGAVDAVEDADSTGGGTALLVDPTDPAAVAAAVIRMLTDHELADRISRRGPSWAARFTAERMMEVLRAQLQPAAG